ATLEASGLVLARLDGDEFGILANADGDTAFAFGRSVLGMLRPPFEVDGIPLAVETSIGGAIGGRGGDAETLIRHADVARYAAKDRRAGIAIYDPHSDPSDAGRLALGGELGRALEGEELVLFYQPKISLSSGHTIGVETLVRWQHPLRGLLPPSEFVPFAERTGLIRPLSRYVLERAIHQCSVWQTAAIEIDVAVNLTMHDLVDPDLPTEVALRLAEAGLPPERLDPEITESSIMGDPFRVRQVPLRLSDPGARHAIDHLRTGYACRG